VASTNGIKLFLGLIFYAIYEIVDVIVMISTAGASEGGEWVLDIFHNFIFNWITGDYSEIRSEGKVFGLIPASIVEFIPVVDVLPTYTFYIWKAWSQYKKDKKSLKGPSSSGGLNININKDGKSSKVKKIILLVIIALLVFGVTFSGKMFRSIRESAEEVDVAERSLGFKDTLLSKINATKTKIMSSFKKQYNIAIGNAAFEDSANELVKQNVGLKLEVYGRRDNAGKETEIYKDQKPYISSTIYGNAISPALCTDLGINCDYSDIIKFTCASTVGPSANDPSSTPFSKLYGLAFNTDCLIDEKSFENTQKKEFYLTQRATFDFMNLAYKKVDFVSRQKYSEIKDDVNFKNEGGVVTPGYIQVNFQELRDYPIVAGAGERFSFGFSIKNIGDGVVDEFNKILFIVPKGANLLHCNFEQTPEAVNRDKIPGSAYNFDKIIKLDAFKNKAKDESIDITCSFELPSDVLDLNADYTISSFNVLVSYSYTLKDKILIKVKGDQMFSTITDCTSFCNSDLGCKCGGDCNTGEFVNKYKSCSGYSYSEANQECNNLGVDNCNSKDDLTNNQECIVENEKCVAKLAVK